jgi:hypothetical protein
MEKLVDLLSLLFSQASPALQDSAKGSKGIALNSGKTLAGDEASDGGQEIEDCSFGSFGPP